MLPPLAEEPAKPPLPAAALPTVKKPASGAAAMLFEATERGRVGQPAVDRDVGLEGGRDVGADDVDGRVAAAVPAVAAAGVADDDLGADVVAGVDRAGPGRAGVGVGDRETALAGRGAGVVVGELDHGRRRRRGDDLEADAEGGDVAALDDGRRAAGAEAAAAGGVADDDIGAAVVAGVGPERAGRGGGDGAGVDQERGVAAVAPDVVAGDDVAGVDIGAVVAAGVGGTADRAGRGEEVAAVDGDGGVAAAAIAALDGAEIDVGAVVVAADRCRRAARRPRRSSPRRRWPRWWRDRRCRRSARSPAWAPRTIERLRSPPETSVAARPPAAAVRGGW